MKWLRVRYRFLRRLLNKLLFVDEKTKEVALTATIQRIYWTAPVMAASTFLAGLTFWLQEEPSMSREALWRDWIIITNLLVSLGSLIIWRIAAQINKRKANRRIQRVFVYFVVTYVFGFGLAISLVDQIVMSSITPFLICATIVATFYYLPPKHSVIVFLLSFVLFRFAFLRYASGSQAILQSNLVNGFVVTAMGLALSFVSWQHFRRTTLQQRTIVKQQEALRKMAYHDSLTYLPNRRYLDELVKQEVALVQRQEKESCLIICDIDHFKQINDTYGHLAGDDLLREFARLLQANLPSSNSLVRLGGEEFVILAPNTSLEQCAILAERLRKLVAGHEFEVDGNKVRITASFGVAGLQGTEGVRDYYSRADQALYKGKKAGRNQVVIARNEATG